MEQSFVIGGGLDESLPKFKGNVFFFAIIAAFVESDILLDGGDKMFLKVMKDGFLASFSFLYRYYGLF